MISTKLATFSVYEAQTTKGGDSNTYRGLANQSRNVRNATRRLEPHPKLSKSSLQPPTKPAERRVVSVATPWKEASKPTQESQQHHRRKNKTNTRAQGCELGRDADSKTANDSRKPSKHLSL
ncbi:hypothetical protein F2Q68_00029753 [Brassica cretica]|uniref:Uncharacterized protein n=1 Tax=Brassica cretica TaxID=69181 RepID=A0A8S9G966_BRACR|nr:hypothetical protein F2Q68_00029753 [Brassica cretica]